MKKILAICIITIMVACCTFVFYKKNKINDTKNKITFWSIQLKPIYEKEIKKIISTFEEENPNFQVVWVDIPIQEAQKRTLAAILSDNPPDLINLNPDFSVLLAQRNALEFFYEEDVEQYNKSLVAKLKYEDKIYALPFYATSPVTVYNKEIYDICIGGNFIKTYDELFKISQKYKICSDVIPFASSLNENDTLAKILNKYNVYDFKNENQLKNAKKVYFELDKMYKNNLLPKDVLTINHREVVEKYMSNQVGIVVVGSNFIDMIKQNAKEIYDNSDVALQLTTNDFKYDIALMNLIIPKKSKNKELAKDFAFILTNKENQLKLAKLTNVLPVNQEALEDEYFKNCSLDLIDKARCIASEQLNNLVDKDFGDKNKKTINELINKTLEEILLDNDTDTVLIENKVENLSKEIKKYQ